MRILPVLDLMNGLVVRGVAGRRREYRPIRSWLTTSAQPLDVALAFREQFGFNELYLADLDAIGGQMPSVALSRELIQQGSGLWVDAGVQQTDLLVEAGVANIIAGLESLQGPGQLHELLRRHGPASLVFSLDLHESKPLGSKSWEGPDAWAIAAEAVRLGVRRLLVLDLASIGMNQGPPTAEICSRLRRTYPELELSTGGGIRSIDDVRGLQEVGVDSVLIASALHDGRLTRDIRESFHD